MDNATTYYVTDAAEAVSHYAELLEIAFHYQAKRERQGKQSAKSLNASNASNWTRGVAGSHTRTMGEEAYDDRRADALARFCILWQTAERTEEEERKAVFRLACDCFKRHAQTIGAAERCNMYIDALDKAQDMGPDSEAYAMEDRSRDREWLELNEYMSELPNHLQTHAALGMDGNTTKDIGEALAIGKHKAYAQRDELRKRLRADLIIARMEKPSQRRPRPVNVKEANIAADEMPTRTLTAVAEATAAQIDHYGHRNDGASIPALLDEEWTTAPAPRDSITWQEYTQQRPGVSSREYADMRLAHACKLDFGTL